MNKKLQVFVSSTYTDLIEERQAAVQAILDAGHIPAGMELFKAGKSQMKTIQKWIDESDVYMLILGGRYGSIEEESGLSYTELEYKYAISKNMPVFAIVLNESFLFGKAASTGKDAVFEKDYVNKYNTFKNFVQKQIVRFDTHIEQNPSTIHAQLNDLLNDTDYNLIGWIRANNITSYQEFGEYTFEQLKQLLQLRVFHIKIIISENPYEDTTIKISALDLLMHGYNSFCAGFSSFSGDNNDTLFYNAIVPFYANIGILSEEIDSVNSRNKHAIITPMGIRLYSHLL